MTLLQGLIRVVAGYAVTRISNIDWTEQLPARQCIVAPNKAQCQSLINRNGIVKSDVPHHSEKIVSKRSKK